MKKRIILDVDPGYDDAFAILLAGKHPFIDLELITVVAGNQSLDKTLKNTIDICSEFKINVEIARGMDSPILRNKITAKNDNGALLISENKVKKQEIEIKEIHAVNYIIDKLLESEEKMILVATGPLTNIAMAIKLCPNIIEKIEKLIIMGGSTKSGNITPKAEFNIFADPEAAYIVFNSKIDMLMIGLNVTEKLCITDDIMENIKNINTEKSKKLYQMIVYNGNDKKNRAIHDPATIAYLIDESIFEMQDMNVEIILESGSGYGQTKCSEDLVEGFKQISVAKDIDIDGFWEILYGVLKLDNKKPTLK